SVSENRMRRARLVGRLARDVKGRAGNLVVEGGGIDAQRRGIHGAIERHFRGSAKARSRKWPGVLREARGSHRARGAHGVEAKLERLARQRRHALPVGSLVAREVAALLESTDEAVG